MKVGNFGDADNLARARGLSMDSVKHAGIVESAAGKVRLLARDELDGDWAPANDRRIAEPERGHKKTSLLTTSYALIGIGLFAFVAVQIRLAPII